MTDTTPDYAGLIARVESKIDQWERDEPREDWFGWQRDVAELAAITCTLLESKAALEREAQKQKERLFKQIDFTGELQRLLWALAEGNPLPDTIKGSHAYTVASRAKARFGGTPE